MLLIYPPIAKPSEPPAGIARLAGTLAAHGIRHSVLDANLEGMIHVLRDGGKLRHEVPDTWTARALRNLPRNLSSLRNTKICGNLDRYKRAVEDINHALGQSNRTSASAISLTNFHHNALSPVRSSDLLRAAESPEGNPFYGYFEEHLPALIEREKPKTVGISLAYLSQALCAFSMMGFLRRRYPLLQLALGGGLITSWMRRPGWKNPFAGLVDICIEGQGEHAVLELAGTQADGKKQYTPAYGALPLGDYLSPGLVLPYNASGGCFWNRCSFCPEKAEDNIYIPLPPRKAAEELSLLTKQLQPALIHLLDNAMSPAFMKAMIENPPGAPWYGFARIDRELADPDFCRALKQAGCVMLKLGVESGDQKVLDALQKGVDLDTASLALQTLKQAGIGTYVYLLFGTPAEAIPEARRTLEFTVRQADTIDFLNLAIFNMPVGVPDADRYGTGSFYEGDLSLYTDFNHPAGWNRKQVRLFLENEFRRHPVISAIVRNDPPYFTSNHAPFFCSRRNN